MDVLNVSLAIFRYQSLHTVVLYDGVVPLEVQIRTKKMHLQAEYGFAAHWRYKESERKHSTFVLQMVEWARWVITWQCEAMSKDRTSDGFPDSIKPPCVFPTHSKDCTMSCKPQCSSDGPVIIIMIENDKVCSLLPNSYCLMLLLVLVSFVELTILVLQMSVQELPTNSTMMDLLETAGRRSSRWTSYRFPVKEELRPRLNHEAVSDPSCKLKMGDVVELTPAIPNKSLIQYREEIRRMYDRGSYDILRNHVQYVATEAELS